MSSRRSVRQLLVAVLLGVLVGGGLTAVTPAGAEVSQAVATNWKKIWKKHLRPLADRRYYTKAQSDTKYATKAESAAAAAAANSSTDTKLGNYYTKAQADTKYSAAGSSYSKTESDAKYAPFPALIRGKYGMEDSAGPSELVSPISFGTTLSAVPTTHFIALGAAIPAGCAGTAAAPNAAPGHLCIFETLSNNVSTRSVLQTSTFGTVAYINPTTGGSPMWSIGNWALRPAALGTTPASPSMATTGKTNGTARSGGKSASESSE